MIFICLHTVIWFQVFLSNTNNTNEIKFILTHNQVENKGWIKRKETENSAQEKKTSNLNRYQQQKYFPHRYYQ